MNISRTVNFVCILFGGLIALYAQAQAKQNVYVLMFGIVLLMFGIYRTSRNIPSKFDAIEKEEERNTQDDHAI